MNKAVAALAPYVDELFEEDAINTRLAEAGIAPTLTSLRPAFDATVDQVFAEALLDRPAPAWAKSGGRKGMHSEAMGYLLADLQYMQRTYPGATW